MEVFNLWTLCEGFDSNQGKLKRALDPRQSFLKVQTVRGKSNHNEKGHTQTWLVHFDFSWRNIIYEWIQSWSSSCAIHTL